MIYSGYHFSVRGLNNENRRFWRANGGQDVINGLKHGKRENRSNGLFKRLSLVAGVGLEPHDLRVMSPTSYQLLHPAIYAFQPLYVTTV